MALRTLSKDEKVAYDSRSAFGTALFYHLLKPSTSEQTAELFKETFLSRLEDTNLGLFQIHQIVLGAQEKIKELDIRVHLSILQLVDKQEKVKGIHINWDGNVIYTYLTEVLKAYYRPDTMDPELCLELETITELLL